MGIKYRLILTSMKGKFNCSEYTEVSLMTVGAQAIAFNVLGVAGRTYAIFHVLELVYSSIVVTPDVEP